MVKGSSYLLDKAIFIIDAQTLDILDVNEQAIERYGYSYREFCGMNLKDLGTKQKRVDLIDDAHRKQCRADKVWKHQNKNGDTFYIQFTYHKINYEERPAHFAVAHDITELIQNKEKQLLKYPKFAGHEANFPLAEIEFTPDLVIKEWSEKAEELFGWSEEEVMGQKDVFEQLIPHKEIEVARKNFQRAIDRKRTQYTVESRNITKDGRVRYCKWHNSLVYDGNGELVSARSLISDITEQKQSQKLFQVLAEESLVGVYLIQNGKFRYVNPRFAEIFGYPKEGIENKISPAELTHPDDRKLVQQKIQARLKGKRESFEYSFRALAKGEKEIDVHVYGSGIRYAGGPAVVGTLVDITRNNKIAKQYQASVESFRDLFDSISDAIYIQDHEGRFLEVNEGAEEMYGYVKDEFIGKTPEFLAAKDKVDLEETKEHIKKAIDGTPQYFDWWGKRKNGEIFPKEVVANPGKYFGEDVVIAIARDVTKRYKAEEQLRRSEEKFRQLFQNAPIGIAFLNKDQQIEHLNQAFTDIFGYETEDIKGELIDEVIVPEELKKEAYKVSEKIFTGHTAHTTAKRKCKDGSTIDTLIYGVPVNVRGETIAIYALYVDITESVEAEEQIKKSLKEKEVLLSEIHHRVKNNLAVITGLLELQTYNTESPEAVKILQDSQMRVNSIALIHEKLYQREDLSQIYFDNYIQELADVIVSSLQTGHTEVAINIDAESVGLTITQAIPCGLILNELITNAYKHAFNGRNKGNINILFNQEGETVKLTVYDDGQGLPEKPDLENSDSLGVQLINTLSAQLQGTASFSNRNPGTQFDLQFDITNE